MPFVHRYTAHYSTTPPNPSDNRRHEFSVRFQPTLVLDDDAGWIIWRHEGRLDSNSAGELERLMQRRLGPRAF